VPRVKLMSNSIHIQQAYTDMQKVISDFPKLKKQIEDTFDLMKAEIDDGKWEDLEVDKFYNYMVEITS
jgi:hypothetical protein